MPEELPRTNESIDIAQAQNLLGYVITPTPGLEPGQYDERLAICQAALDAQEAMRETKRLAALSLGIEVSPDEVAAWTPNLKEAEALRSSLSRERIRARMLDSVESFIADGKMTDKAMGTPLRWNQQDMLVESASFLRGAPRTVDGGKGGAIGAPPGAGKTGVISKLAAAHKYNEDPAEPVKIIVLVNTIAIMRQTLGEDGTRGFGKFAPHLDVGLRYSDEHDVEHDVVIMPAASFNLLMKQGKMPDSHVVILDEVDAYAGGEIGANLREYCKDKVTYGLSATIDTTTRELLPNPIYDMDIPTAIRSKLLAPMTAEVLHPHYTEIDESELPDDPAERRAAIQAQRLRDRIEDMKLRITKDIENGLGVVVRCSAGDDIEVAKQVARELRELSVVVPNDGSWPAEFKTITRKIRAMEIGGSEQATASGRRLQQLVFGLYNDKKADAFPFVKAIQRGWDASHAKVYYDLDPRGSWKEKTQGFGRVGRLVVDKHGNIVLKDGKPIGARVNSYFDPDYPDQYTGVQALGGEPGQDRISVGHQEFKKPKDPAARFKMIADTGATVLASTVEVLVVDHQADTVSEPRAVEYDPTPLNFQQAARRLGVSPLFLANLYTQHGYDRDATITVADLDAMLELSHPALRITPLPAQGYTSAQDVLSFSGLKITVAQLLIRARNRGFRYHKFLDGDVAGHFFADHEVFTFLDSLKSQPEET